MAISYQIKKSANIDAYIDFIKIYGDNNKKDK